MINRQDALLALRRHRRDAPQLLEKWVIEIPEIDVESRQIDTEVVEKASDG
jgi:hypothetical protein